MLGFILVNNIMAASTQLKEKRSLIILFYIPVLYMAYHISALSFGAYTFFFIVGMSCLFTLIISKNTTFKDIVFSIICGLSIFFTGFLLYNM
ncbi:hypothetical protein DRF59_03875 [Chryseobacterium flavum]|uniref:Uncharacterized protein n=1 Tax=Chryseobacterium flavum TaxID=415851 RepID=A0A3D9CTM7_9FLAO|nr:hypothetical protein DRF59_03875 [Chryseobacterium flavum]